MARVLIHGNPETAVVWDPLVEALAARGAGEVVRLSPPGFGAPVPDGFAATRSAYVDWLAGALEERDGPHDLVGHDWGALHVHGILDRRPDLVRTWATDCCGILQPGYRWHGWARIWQRSGLGELAVWSLVNAPLWLRVRSLLRERVPRDTAEAMAPAQNGDMGRCILALYRSAQQPAMADLGRRVMAGPRRPGLVIVPTADPYAGPPEDAEAVAQTLGARVVRLEGLGHWWMARGADRVADALLELWSRPRSGAWS